MRNDNASALSVGGNLNTVHFISLSVACLLVFLSFYIARGVVVVVVAAVIMALFLLMARTSDGGNGK